MPSDAGVWYLQGLKHVILVAALDRRIHLRQYAISLKRSGTTVSLSPLFTAIPHVFARHAQPCTCILQVTAACNDHDDHSVPAICHRGCIVAPAILR